VTYAALLTGPVAPLQPSGSLKLTARGSDPSEPCVSAKKIYGRTLSDMFRPLSDMPAVTTHHTQVAKTCLHVGELPNKTPFFISMWKWGQSLPATI